MKSLDQPTGGRRPRRGVGCLLGLVAAALVLVLLTAGYLWWALHRLPPTVPEVAILEPPASSVVDAGRVVLAHIRASDPEGVSQVEAWVNGELIGTQINPSPEPDGFFFATFAWVPRESGIYVVDARARDPRGYSGRADSVVVEAIVAEPPPESIEYIVQPGETLASIAETLGTYPEAITGLTPSLDPGTLAAGDTIVVPFPSGGAEALEVDRPPDAPSGSGSVPAPEVAPAHEGGAPPAGASLPASVRPEAWSDRILDPTWVCLLSPAGCDSAMRADPPRPPEDAVASPSASCGVMLEWTDTSETEDGFRVYRMTDGGRTLLAVLRARAGAGTRLLYRDESVGAGTFVFAVEAYNEAGARSTMPTSVTIDARCSAASRDPATVVTVEALGMSTREALDRVYCYLSLAGSPYERVPLDASQFISADLRGGYDIAAEFGEANSRQMPIDGAQPLEVAADCSGWRGSDLVVMGGFHRSHPPAEWDGRELTAGPEDGAFQVAYRIQRSPSESSEAVGAAVEALDWDPYLPVPHSLETTTSWDHCYTASWERTCVTKPGPGLTWQWEPDRLTTERFNPSGFNIYKRLSGEREPALYHTVSPPSMRGPTGPCGETAFYSVSAVVRSHETFPGSRRPRYVRESSRSEELEVTPTGCPGYVEVLLGPLKSYTVCDGMSCSYGARLSGVYGHDPVEAYGWLDVGDVHIRWSCQDCAHTPISSNLETTMGEFPLSVRYPDLPPTGFGPYNDRVRLPISDTGLVRIAFTFMDYDDVGGDDLWCQGAISKPYLRSLDPIPIDRTPFVSGEGPDGTCRVYVRAYLHPGDGE